MCKPMIKCGAALESRLPCIGKSFSRYNVYGSFL
jgi:hypothetical protein